MNTDSIKQKDMKQVNELLNNVCDTIRERYGIALQVQTANLSKRGIVNIGLKGGREGSAVRVNPAKIVQDANTKSPAERRFEQYHHTVGLRKNDLHQTFTFDGKMVTLTGLRGQTNDVVIEYNNGDERTVDAAEFKKTAKRA